MNQASIRRRSNFQLSYQNFGGQMSSSLEGALPVSLITWSGSWGRRGERGTKVTRSAHCPRQGTRPRPTTRWQTQSVRKSPRGHNLPHPTDYPQPFFFFFGLLTGGSCLHVQSWKTVNTLAVIPFFPMLTPLTTTTQNLKLSSCITR